VFIKCACIERPSTFWRLVIVAANSDSVCVHNVCTRYRFGYCMCAISAESVCVHNVCMNSDSVRVHNVRMLYETQHSVEAADCCSQFG